MFEYLREIFTKPELQRSFIDNLAVMTVILVGIFIVFLTIILIMRIINYFAVEKSCSCDNCDYNRDACRKNKCIGCRNYKRKK